MTGTDAETKFLRKLATAASANQKWLDGVPAPVLRRLVEEYPLVVGVWPDADGPCGIDFAVIKGWRVVLQTVAGDLSGRTRSLILLATAQSKPWSQSSTLAMLNSMPEAISPTCCLCRERSALRADLPRRERLLLHSDSSCVGKEVAGSPYASELALGHALRRELGDNSVVTRTTVRPGFSAGLRSKEAVPLALRNARCT
jgi:hypothetical protein